MGLLLFIQRSPILRENRKIQIYYKNRPVFCILTALSCLFTSINLINIDTQPFCYFPSCKYFRFVKLSPGNVHGFWVQVSAEQHDYFLQQEGTSAAGYKVDLTTLKYNAEFRLFLKVLSIIRRVLNGPVPRKSCSERDRESLANLTCFGEFSSNPIFSNSKKKALFVQKLNEIG